MDPNETLRLLRLTIKQYHVDTDPFVRAAHGREIAEYFESLDEWISKGGFLPDAWTRTTAVPHTDEQSAACVVCTEPIVMNRQTDQWEHADQPEFHAAIKEG